MWRNFSDAVALGDSLSMTDKQNSIEMLNREKYIYFTSVWKHFVTIHPYSSESEGEEPANQIIIWSMYWWKSRSRSEDTDITESTCIGP